MVGSVTQPIDSGSDGSLIAKSHGRIDHHDERPIAFGVLGWRVVPAILSNSLHSLVNGHSLVVYAQAGSIYSDPRYFAG
jgi:hypothetical protein